MKNTKHTERSASHDHRLPQTTHRSVIEHVHPTSVHPVTATRSHQPAAQPFVSSSTGMVGDDDRQTGSFALQPAPYIVNGARVKACRSWRPLFLPSITVQVQGTENKKKTWIMDGTRGKPTASQGFRCVDHETLRQWHRLTQWLGWWSHRESG